jgi:hypothetical protein
MVKTCEISKDLKDKIAENVEGIIHQIFSSYFGVDVVVDDAKSSEDKSNTCLCQVHMQQKDMDMFLRFNFDKSLLARLVEDAYSSDGEADTMAAYNDAACEIANIVCCKVKALLNGNGYNLDMDIPKSIDSVKKIANHCDALNLHFSVDSGDGFCVILVTTDQKYQ